MTADPLTVCIDLMGEIPSREWHVDELVKRAIETNKNLGYKSEELRSVFGRVLNSNAQSKKPLVIKPKNSSGGKKNMTYRLRQVVRDKLKPKTVDYSNAVGTGHVGAAGEHVVAAFLLLSGYNVSRPAVDTGVDLIAEKDGKYKAIQVKTTFINDGKAMFNIRGDAFTRTEDRGMVYVFVVKTPNGNDVDFQILSYSVIALAKSLKFSPSKKTITVTVEKDTLGRFYFDGMDVSSYVNDFRKISTM